MMHYNIKFLVYTLSLALVLGLAGLYSFQARAQYRGSFVPEEEPEETVNPEAPPVPQIFSSQVMSKQEAQKLDVLYNSLHISLWNFAVSDFSYQKKLNELMDPKRFHTTRYSKEFSGDLKQALDSLNDNYKKMLRRIERVKEDYTSIREGIRSTDYEVLDPLWDERIGEFEETAKSYFKMQHQYLNTYRNLVAFILKNGGRYFYDSKARRVGFFNFGLYEYFAKQIDKLNDITHEQKKLLKRHPPATNDPILLD
ncbi:MAG: hypothetical protein ACLFU1_04615 [Alphaproteobacteria bacterium]